MGRNFKIAMLIVGTVIGAGFASGRELVRFFVQYGRGAYGFAVLAGLLFFGGFYAIMRICEKLPHRTVEGFHRKIFGKGAGLGTGIMLLNNTLIAASMMGAFDLLVPAPGFPYGGLIAGVGVFAVLLFGTGGLVHLNTFSVPLMAVMTVVVAVSGMAKSGGGLYLVSQSGGLLSALLYFGMNILTLGGVLCEFEVNKKGRLLAAGLAAGLITVLILIEILTVRTCGTVIVNHEMPMLAVAESVHLGALMRIVLSLGIFTTLASAVHVNTAWLRELIPNRALSLGAVLISAWFISRLGFGKIVDHLYPVLGGLGLVLIAAVLFSCRPGKLRLRRLILCRLLPFRRQRKNE